jgi:hypothetical protein
MHLSAPRCALLASLFVLAAACGSPAAEGDAPEGGEGTGGTRTADPSAGESAATPAAAGAAPSGTAPEGATIDVQTTVVGYVFDTPLASRAVRIVDALGKHFDATTDASGGISVHGVTTPYDVVVAPYGATDFPTVYLGLLGAKPFLYGSTDYSAMAWGDHTFKTRLSVSPCKATSCTIAIATKSAQGAGSGAATYVAGATVVDVDVRHRFQLVGQSSETVAMHVLVHDAVVGSYSVASTNLPIIIPGTSSVGPLVPMPTVVRGPVTLDSRLPGVPTVWEQSGHLSITYADGASVALDPDFSGTIAVKLPNIAGAKISVSASAYDPAGNLDDTIDNRVSGWSAPVAISSATSVTVAGASLAQNLVPGPHASLSIKAAGISWDARSTTMTSLSLSDLTNKKLLAYVWTEGASVPFEALEALGIVLVPTQAAFQLSSYPANDMAAFTSSDPTVRGRLASQLAAGATSSQRRQFQLTP